MTLAEITTSHVYIWYSEFHVETTIAILNYLKQEATSGKKIFYSIYSELEIQVNPDKANTGVFFFRGAPGAKVAIMSAGGGFVYVGAMQDSFPHALEVSKQGYNAFVLIYRPKHAYQDLAKAIAFIHDHATDFAIDFQGYSLWGGSAGARMAAKLGEAGAMKQFGRGDIPQAAAVVLQYTGDTSVSKRDAPTYANVGTADWIADYRTMQRRLQQLESIGIPTAFYVYRGLGHGFGIGTRTIAEGWITDAITFWEQQINEKKE